MRSAGRPRLSSDVSTMMPRGARSLQSRATAIKPTFGFDAELTVVCGVRSWLTLSRRENQSAFLCIDRNIAHLPIRRPLVHISASTPRESVIHLQSSRVRPGFRPVGRRARHQDRWCLRRRWAPCWFSSGARSSTRTRAVSSAVEVITQGTALGASIAPSWNEISKRADITASRTILNFFLRREMADESPRRRRGNTPTEHTPTTV